MRDLQAAGLCPVCSLNLARFQDSGYTSFMRKLLTTTLLLAAALCLAAASTYDIGGGRQLVLDENGTYSIIQTEFDTSPLVGRQFVIDYDALMDTAVDLAVAEEPSLLILGRDTLSALVEELGLIDELRAQVPDFSLIFISEDRVVATMAGEEPAEMAYTVDGSGMISLENPDGETEKLGLLEEDCTRIRMDADGITVFLMAVRGTVKNSV